MKTTTRFTFEEVPFDEATDAHLVVTLAAPPRPGPAARPPVCVLPVIDVSGSMAGEKLHFAKQAVMKLVDHLAPGDRCGVVVFSTRVETLAAPAEMTQARKDALKGLVGRLSPQQNTNLGGGLLAGLDHARVAKLPPGMLVRVILFTDGLANEGPAKTRAEILALLEENLGEATLSAFGFGDDADQELLRDLATRGKGNYAYVRGPEDALTAFARELGALLSTVAQRIEVTVAPRDGLVLTDVVSDVDATEERGVVRVRIPDLLAEEERTIVLAGRLGPRPAASAADGETVADVTVAFETFEGGRVVGGAHSLAARVRFVPAAEAQRRPTPEVDAQVAVAQLVRAQIDAEEAARRGHFEEAGQVMVLFQSAVSARGHEAVADAAGKIGRRVSDADAYRGSAAYRSSMRKGGSRGVTTLYQEDAAADLAAMGQAKRTAAQQRMERAFGAPGEREGGAAGAGGGIRRKRSRRW
jgi:Ca-activated chloride channel family protein